MANRMQGKQGKGSARNMRLAKREEAEARQEAYRKKNGTAAVKEWEAENGALTEEELKAADTVLSVKEVKKSPKVKAVRNDSAGTEARKQRTRRKVQGDAASS